MKFNKKIIIITIIIILINIIYFLYDSHLNETFINHVNDNNNNDNDNAIPSIQPYVLYIPKREKYIKNVMNKLGINKLGKENINVKYILGPPKENIIMEQLHNKDMISDSYYEKNKKEGTGEVAVFLGHVEILETFLKSDHDYALIFEDDIFLPNEEEKQKEINIKIKNIIKNIPAEAEILYFGYCFEDCKKSKVYKKNPTLFKHAIRPVCLHSYLVSKKGAKILLREIIPLSDGLDVVILGLINKKIINAFTVNNDYLQILQNRKELGSDISNMNHAADIPTCIIGNWTGNPRN